MLKYTVTSNESGTPKELTQYEFDGMSDWLSQCKSNSGYVDRAGSHNVTLAQAKNLAIHGWADGVSRLDKYQYAVDKIVGEKIQEPAINYDVTGLGYDIGMVVTGIPECWFDQKMPEAKIVKVMLNPSADASVSTKSIELRGAMVAGLIDCLEKAGHRVQLDMIYGNMWDEIRCKVPIKSADQQLDRDKLAFLAIHPSCLRTLWFSVLDTLGHASGCSYHPQQIDRDEYDVTIERLNHEMSEVQIVQWVKAQLVKFGVEFEQ